MGTIFWCFSIFPVGSSTVSCYVSTYVITHSHDWRKRRNTTEAAFISAILRQNNIILLRILV